MIDRDGEPKVLDFGIAKLQKLDGEATGSMVTNAGVLLGTPGYMPPEQLLGSNVDERADVFAFGVTLYEMLTGVRKVERDDSGAIDLWKKNPLVPEKPELIVDRCLALAAGHRYANGRELVEALDALAAVDTLAAATQESGDAPPNETPKRTRTWPLVAFGAVVLAGGVGAALGLGARKQASLAAPADAAALAQPVTLTNAPLPKSASREALVAYASGLTLVRDASRSAAVDDFRRAAMLDPQLGAAHLRAVLYGGPAMTRGERREHYAAAWQHRMALDPRDFLLLSVAESYVSDEPSSDAMIAQARVVRERFPNDAELALTAGEILLRLERFDEARTAYQAALALDPQLAYAQGEIGVSHRLRGETSLALSAFTKCIEMSPSAGHCFRGRADIAMAAGNCAEAEVDARRMLVVEPKSYRTYEYLALALAGKDAPLEGVKEALTKRSALQPDDRKPLAAAQAKLWAALLEGDLITSETAAEEWEQRLASSLVESDHAKAMHHRLDVLEERGDFEKALAVADAYERRSSAWTRDDPLGVRMRIAILRRHGNKIDAATLERTRAELVRETNERRSAVPADWVWYFSRATFLETREEATAALTQLPEAGPPSAATGLWGDNIGRMHLLAGEPQKALPYLRDAAMSCSVMSSEESPAATTVWYMRANVSLGRALEETGDAAGACRAYAVVADRWRAAKPRSLALEAAKDAMRRLRCPR